MAAAGVADVWNSAAVATEGVREIKMLAAEAPTVFRINSRRVIPSSDRVPRALM